MLVNVSQEVLENSGQWNEAEMGFPHSKLLRYSTVEATEIVILTLLRHRVLSLAALETTYLRTSAHPFEASLKTQVKSKVWRRRAFACEFCPVPKVFCPNPLSSELMLLGNPVSYILLCSNSKHQS